MSENNNNMNGKDFLIGALVGGIIGAGAALLLTPKSGRELRVNISDGYQTASKKTKEIAKNVGEKSEVFAGKVKEVAEHVKDDIQKRKLKETEDKVEVKAEESAIEGVQEEVAASLDKTAEDQEDQK